MAKQTVLAATDLREASDEAIRQAHEWARRRDARLVVCHIVPRMVGSDLLFPQAIQRQAIDQAEVGRRAAELLRQRAELVTGRPRDELDVIVDSGSADAECVRHARELHADLIVVGSHGHAGLTRIFLADVAERIVREAPCPVLVARPHPPTRRILVGTDFSQPAEQAIRLAAEEARLRGAKLTLMTSIEKYMREVSWMSGFGAAGDFVEREYQDERQKTERQLRQLLEREQITGDVEVTDLSPAAAMIETAGRIDADLVVIGAVGARWLERLRLGRVAEKLARHAPCSVLVVRGAL
ncbi:MAG TPA: universal stress protein [Polyangia bacterium]